MSNPEGKLKKMDYLLSTRTIMEHPLGNKGITRPTVVKTIKNYVWFEQDDIKRVLKHNHKRSVIKLFSY